MNQTFSISTFVGGLATFLSLGAEILSQHATWGEFTATPTGMAHLFLLGASFVMMIAGALGIQLPRAGSAHGDRSTDPPPAPPAPPKP